MKKFSLGNVFFWGLGILPFLGLMGCFAPPAFNGNPSDIGNSDYEQDRRGRREFSRDYLKISPRVYVSSVNPVYDETISYFTQTSVWEQGFTVRASNIPNMATVDLFLVGVDPGDLIRDIYGSQMIVNLYDQEGKRYYSNAWPVNMTNSINVNRNSGQYLNQTIHVLVLFTQINSTQGYAKMTPITIQTL